MNAWRTIAVVRTGMPIVDLHDLNMRLARQAVRATIAMHPNLRCGAICFVTEEGVTPSGACASRDGGR